MYERILEMEFITEMLAGSLEREIMVRPDLAHACLRPFARAI